VGRLVVIEGLDGAGKRTLADGLLTALRAAGASTATIAFPRYGRSVPADLVGDALYGRAGDLSASVYGMAALYALDRACARDELHAAHAQHNVLLLDRYIASNAAYGAARLHQDVDGEFVAWVRALELDRLRLPAPDIQLLLRVPPALAAQRAQGRASVEADRPRDSFESDDGLQARTAAVYDQLAARRWLSAWTVLDGAPAIDYAALAATLLTTS
jgi:dTMP kinase